MINNLYTLQTGCLSQLKNHIPDLSSYSRFVILTHPTLQALYGEPLKTALKHFNRPILEILVPEGEPSKSLSQSSRCWKKMHSSGIDRQSLMIALGGGVICDLAGFVASCYMRGIETLFVPTSLMAMVDAALGGKTAINLPSAKNVVGTFHQPKWIVIDPLCLASLPQREFNSGLAEVIKYGIIKDAHLFEELEEGLEKIKEQNPIFLEKIIQHCLSIKNQIVSQDRYDQTGERALLNYGHTFGHAIESLTHYRRYLHGEAIAIGMSCAAHLSVKLGLCPFSLPERQDHLFRRAELPTHLPPLNIDQLLKTMKRDKKNHCGKISLILPERIGKVVKVADIDSFLIKEILLKRRE